MRPAAAMPWRATCASSRRGGAAGQSHRVRGIVAGPAPQRVHGAWDGVCRAEAPTLGSGSGIDIDIDIDIDINIDIDIDIDIGTFPTFATKTAGTPRHAGPGENFPRAVGRSHMKRDRIG